MKAPPSRKRGFTLIELMVVIAIIGLLSSVVLASLSTARKKAITASTLLQVKQALNAFNLYYDENSKLPGVVDPNPFLTIRYCIGMTSCVFYDTAIGNSIGSTFTKFLSQQSGAYPLINVAGVNHRGLSYRCLAMDSNNNCTTGSLFYPVPGYSTTICGVGSVYIGDSNNVGTTCTVNVLQPSSAIGY